MIELKYLSKTFQMKDGAVKALQNINLTIPDGAIYGIIGMSGAGKSTLVRCINLLGPADHAEGRLAPPLGRTIQDTVQGQRSEKGQVSGTHAKHPVREKVSDRSSENTPHGLNKQNLATILFSRLIIFHKFAADSSAESLRVVSGESCLYREDVYKRLSFVFQNFAVFFISPER